MRATLEQLKAMSDGELRKQWGLGAFPFDKAVGCECCLTMHSQLPLDCAHRDLSAEAVRIGAPRAWDLTGAWLAAHIEELYAMRMFHDSLYPQTVEAAEEKTIAELAPLLVTRGLLVAQKS